MKAQLAIFRFCGYIFWAFIVGQYELPNIICQLLTRIRNIENQIKQDYY